MTSKVTSNELKASLMYYYRIKKRFKYIATECGLFRADLSAVNASSYLIEVEVKVSLQDLKNDFKKPKHLTYLKTNRARKKMWTPSKFYFCVPEALLEATEKLVKQHNPSYGILVYRTHSTSSYSGRKRPIKLEDRVKQVKSAKLIHRRKVSEALKSEIVSRMSSEIMNFHIKGIKI